MNSPDEILQERLTTLNKDYSCCLDNRINEIQNLWQITQYGYTGADELIQLRDISHNIAAAGTPFGFTAICDAANKLAQLLLYLQDGNKKLADTQRRQIELLIHKLESAVANKNNPSHMSGTRRWKPALLVPNLYEKTATIFIVAGDSTIWGSVWGSVIAELQQKGYRLRIFESFAHLQQVLPKQIPRVIITDKFIYEEDDITRSSHLDNILNADIPLIFIAHDDDIHVRLRAIRSGANTHFAPPLDLNKLINKVEELTAGIPNDPYRVMIVDDDRAMAEFYAYILKQEGMHTTLVHNPFKVLEFIGKTRPELIILNSTMRDCSGLELTAIIRQQEGYAGTSIVFLLNDADCYDQLEAAKAGGDDFITLPIEPDYLVAVINSRVRRARTLNTMNDNLFKALRDLENQYFAINQHAIVSITNINGNIVYINDKFCEISGYTKAELLGKDHNILNSGIHDQQFFRRIWDTISKGNVWQGEVCNKKKNGELYWLDMTIVPFVDEQSRPYQYVAINNDITSRILAEQNLSQARDVAVNASQAKSDFLSKMSHELRTPLNAVLGFSQLLESSRESPLTKTQLQYISEIHSAGNHLLDLINEVLDLSRIEANQLHVENINIPLSVFLDECSALIKPLTLEKNITINSNYRKNEELHIYADPIRLKQIMVNLLSNAIKYNTYSGEIGINVKTGEGNRIIIEVSDTGVGIYPEQIDNLFKPFARLAQHKQIEGVGIGLALSKRLIELMGGDIGVRSSVGGGSTFWIGIKQADAGNIERSCKANTNIDIIKHNHLPADVPYNLLYIEDNETNFKLVREILRIRQNIKLSHAVSAEAGMEYVISHTPDLILLDLQLPGLSGLDAIDQFRKIESIRNTPVIAISAFVDEATIELAYKKGVSDYIIKPMETSRLLAAINTILNRGKVSEK